MVKKRLDYVDAISGIMILRMVYTHCCEFASVNDHDVIYSYLGCFLLWFFYKGGVMNKPVTMRQAVDKGRDRLLRPFIAWSVIGLCLDVVLFGVDRIIGLAYYQDNEMIRSVGSLLLNGSVHGNMPAWFLLTYFMVKVLYAWIDEKHSSCLSFCSLGIALVLPFALQQLSFRYPYYLCNVFIGFAAFSLASKLAARFAGVGSFRRILLGISVGIFILIPLVQPCSYDIRTNTIYAGFYPLWWLWVLSACVAISCLFRHSQYLTRICKYVGLTCVGEKSMFILCYHWPVLLFLDFTRKALWCGLSHEWFLLYYGVGLLILGIPLYFMISQSRIKKYLL